MAKGLFSGVRVGNLSHFLIHRHFPGANVDEATNSSTKGAKSGRRVQLVPIPDRDEGRGTNDQNCNFSSCTILGHHKEQKKFFFFFPKASTGSVSLIIAPKVSQDCLNDQADTADHSL